MITPMDALINSIEILKGKESECLVKHFRLVKVILPASMVEQIKNEFSPDNATGLEEGQVHSFTGIPVEKDYHIRKPQFVIEGDLELL